MNKIFGLALLSLTFVPSAASAATVGGNVDPRHGTEFGVITFQAAKGETNRLTVTTERGLLRFHDRSNPVKAKGDCKQIDSRTARCPSTEDPAQAKLGNRADHVQVKAELVRVFGGSGEDVLRGFRGDDVLAGDGGTDELHGGPGTDELTGGPGRDRIRGGSGDDELIDGESDDRSARDIFRGGDSRDTKFGADRGDVIDYSKRDLPVRVDLGRGRSNTGDRILGLESIVGGSGDDRLTGDGDDNWLEGEDGDDRLGGRGGRDIPQGGDGDDVVRGDDGDDTVWGDRGADALFGGPGGDLLISRDTREPEVLNCGSGRDDADSTRADTLEACEIAHASTLHVAVQPAIAGETATLRVACQRLGGCSGTVAITSLDGIDYGSGEFANLPDDPQTFTDVVIELTPAGSAALAEGEIVQVAYGHSGGYRAFMQGG